MKRTNTLNGQRVNFNDKDTKVTINVPEGKGIVSIFMVEKPDCSWSQGLMDESEYSWNLEIRDIDGNIVVNKRDRKYFNLIQPHLHRFHLSPIISSYSFCYRGIADSSCYKQSLELYFTDVEGVDEMEISYTLCELEGLAETKPLPNMVAMGHG